MTQDDRIYRFRLQLFSLAAELGSVRAACRMLDVHPSTYYRWQRQLRRHGPEILRPRERRAPRMPNAIALADEERIVRFAVAHPGYGPKRISAELARARWGGLSVSPNGVWRVLRRHGLSTRARRLALVAGYAAPPEPGRPEPRAARHLAVEHPGELVQFDCFCIGRLSGTTGVTWQYTAIDVGSAYVWAELHTTPRNPMARYTSALAERVAADLAARGWRLERAMTDNGSEFTSHVFGDTLRAWGATQTRIFPGRPQTNGCVERVQGTILEECWKPAFARYVVPKVGGLARELERYLDYYNTDRAHTGRWTRGRTPEQVIGAAKMWS